MEGIPAVIDDLVSGILGKNRLAKSNKSEPLDRVSIYKIEKTSVHGGLLELSKNN